MEQTHQTPRTTLKPFALAAGRMFLAVSQSLAEYVRTRVVCCFSASKSAS